ncbi:membrane protein insertase YidC [Candidatus Peregrinibacteria bacterium]|nr:membrane protein insertase YidC [Candidatus Peregrinibacteria bacterium]
MENLNKILKNLIVFFAVFLTLNFIFQSCQGDKELPADTGNLLLTTTKDEYGVSKTVTIEIENLTGEEVVIPNECPSEPLNVYRYENNKWTQKTSSPPLNCPDTSDITLAHGDSTRITYENWNYALFSDKGRYKIELDYKGRAISSNEFIVTDDGLIKKLWNGVFYKPIYNGLIWLVAIIPGHYLGWAIILLTLIIRTILLVPNHKAMVSQKKLQDIQPRLEKIKEKYKGDQQKISMETMALWKEAKVNPMGSCLPILLQFPFLIALFYVIKGGLNPDKIHLLYTTYENFSISDINVHFLGLDLTKTNLYVLPLIVGGLQFIQVKLSMARKKKKSKNKKQDEMMKATNMMLYIMPVMIAVFAASLPAGVGVYWGVSTLYGIFQQLIINKSRNKGEAKVKVIKNS